MGLVGNYRLFLSLLLKFPFKTFDQITKLNDHLANNFQARASNSIFYATAAQEPRHLTNFLLSILYSVIDEKYIKSQIQMRLEMLTWQLEILKYSMSSFLIGATANSRHKKRVQIRWTTSFINMRQGLRTVTADSVEKINGFLVKIKK